MKRELIQQITFEKDSQIEEELGEFINPDDFVNRMKELGQIDNISGDYSSDIYKLCRNSVAWFIIQIRNNCPIYLEEIQIAEGTFMGKDHSWIQIGDYFVDLTLSQFIDSPKLAICKSKIGKRGGYCPDEILSIDEWISGGYMDY